MGLLGLEFKVDLICISEYLFVGLTTGFLGSLTTFCAWMQAMLNLSVEGHLGYAAAGLLIGAMT